MADDFEGRAAPLTQQGFDEVARQLGGDVASLWALINVETRGFGFFSDRRPKVLFERHQFHQRTAGRFDASNPDISASIRGGYLGGTAEYGRLLGFNAVRLRYPSAEDMVTQFLDGEDRQLDGVLHYIQSNPALESAFRTRNWARVAFFYNGSAFAENQYDIKLQRFHDLFTITGTPSIDVRAAQARLAYLGFDPHGIDGVVGNGTRSAVIAFQKARGITPTGQLDGATMVNLSQAAGV
jgi:hypothetical protein